MLANHHRKNRRHFAGRRVAAGGELAQNEGISELMKFSPSPPLPRFAIQGLAVLSCLSHAIAQESLFPPGKTGNDSGAEGNFYELGTIFRPTVDGNVTHLRVYALAAETGAHTARLWRNSTGTVIGGPYPWTYGGTTGWITLDVPDVPVLANADYTVVVTTGGGGRNYAFLNGDLAVAGGNGAHLTHPANAGVFTTTSAARPATAFQGSNYLRDVLFVPAPTEPPTNGPVRINEFLAENQAGLLDEDGAASDWLELYNPTAAPIAIGGYQLTDGSATWIFPATVIGAQQFLVVFASGKDRATLPMHTNFKLDNAGEYLALKDAGGMVIGEFAPAFPRQRADYSHGQDAAGNTGYFFTPTPGTANGPSFSGFVADTVFSVKRGFFTVPVQVGITTATSGATIRYTLDGSAPNETSAAYAGAFTISTTTTLRARAFKTNFLPTNTDTNTYIFPADLLLQTNASTLAGGWPSGPINGQILRYGLVPVTLPLYSQIQKLNALAQLPTLSLVTDQANLTGATTGIYVNATTDGMERPASLEMINPDNTPAFQIDAGLRIRGGQSRGANFPKHSFNLFFRGEHGASKLQFPLFGADGARNFDTISLRCEHGYAYADPFSLGVRIEFTAMRDVFCRDLWGAAGYASTRSRYYHLLLNGQYWGLYQTQERAQEDFGATYFGGSAIEYDGVAATGLPQLTIEATAGDLTAWTDLWTKARAVNANPTNANYFALLGRNADGTPNAALPALLDPHELAAYMLLHYYTGHADEPLSVSFNWEKPNNFRALRRRGTTEPWHFIMHDGESSVRATEWFDDRANAVNLTSPNRDNLTFSNPEWIHEDLLANAEYRIAFADVAQRHFHHGGAFTPARAQTHWDALAGQIDQAVIGESLRWAQTADENQANWNAKVASVRALFFPTRTVNVIAQMRSSAKRGFALFPSVDAPLFSQRGGQVAAGFQVALSAAGGGAIYFTLDGSDPRAIGGGIAGTPFSGAITINSQTLVRARFRSGTGEWSGLDEAFFSTFAPAIAGKLILSKVQYHPLPPGAAEIGAGFNTDNDFEYLEFQNVSTETLDLRGVKVNAGVTFDFAAASITTLAPGARVCLAENAAAFASRYGAGLPLAGIFTGNLNDSGETVRVIDGAGAGIALFTYDDAPPWPLAPDGDGAALVLIAAQFDPAIGANWRASYSTGGKPGELDVLTLADWRTQIFSAADLADPAKESTVWGAAADPDRDGIFNVLEFALASSPLASASRPEIVPSVFTAAPGMQFLRATYRVREGTIGLAITPQVSSDLITWTADTRILNGPASQGDGTALIVVEDSTPLPTASGARRFLRLHVQY